ncbi:2,3,4,5-tetrahydropyridine-2,6-dicarboxylate N-succinyltransferase [Candidatus Vidania fulgoroideae]|uniref:2,3,4,5-tetrahydropyridine-2,6-dicarboxylate N-succinyltransferase n=1 Tax=Candidatus Vidania fulgoroideorum TaxID=881286 RepID=A0A974X9M6_9PROT|nr:2,3,4,5-tetrahydropyridine-2,6-dicarboxylate N-succinyltransferase [Candidatus Vidania fulgoroideae]
MNIRKIDLLWKKQDLDIDECNYISSLISLLNKGIIKVVNKVGNTWISNSFIKKAIVLYIRNSKRKLLINNTSASYDIFTNKLLSINPDNNIRFTHLSYARYGSYISGNSILMPCFINIGAYISSNCMIDTWATIGSCAYIGRNVHISGGAGIGGVIEPICNNPVIIEDNCFIGARSELVEGVVLKSGCVISMGVFIGRSTKVYSRLEDKFYYSYVPKNSVVVPGSINYGKYSLNCPIIVKNRDKSTDTKVCINNSIRK